MIRDYEKGDELRLNPNEFSEVTDDMREIFANDRFVKHTLEDDGEIKCILCWMQYSPKQYAIFFLMPDGVEFKHARALKRFLDKETERLKPKSCITYSVNCDRLNRWHKFFGFEKQRDDMSTLSGQYNKWLIKWV